MSEGREAADAREADPLVTYSSIQDDPDRPGCLRVQVSGPPAAVADQLRMHAARLAPTGVQVEIAAAVKNYRKVWPEPHSLAPNLALAVRAADLYAASRAEADQAWLERDHWAGQHETPADSCPLCLAALPPVAGPGVRPDETLRAARGFCSCIDRPAADCGIPSHRAEAVAAPAPAPGDEGLRARIEALHHEVNEFGFLARCAVCMKPTGDAYMDDSASYVLWPCDTIRALASPAPAATEVGEGER